MRLALTHRMGLLIVLTACSDAGALAGTARLQAGEESSLAVPRMGTPPRIDGTIDPAEWREAAAIAGAVDQGTDILIPRPTTFFLAWDPGHLYFACRTYVRAGYKPGIRDGRSQGGAYVFDDGLELLFKPMGENVSAMNRQTAFRMFLNCLGNYGDLTRLAVGQQLRNWGSRFQTAARMTAPGTAPNGGSWWELEVSTSLQDFELTGENKAGDKWLVMLGINHIPMWMQARIPCVGSYYAPEGKTGLVLVENTPAVQFTMDSLENLASDGTAALTIRAFNPAEAETQVTVDVNVAGKIVKTETLKLPAVGDAAFTLAEKLPADVKAGDLSVSVRQADTVLLRYKALFEVGKYNWMLAPVTPPDPNKFAFEARWNPLRRTALVKADSYYLPDPKAAKALKYRVVPEAGRRAVAEGTVTNVAEWYFQDLIHLPRLRAGKYKIEGSLELADGRTLGPLSATIEKKEEARAFPEWWGKRSGDVERVLPPFTAIQRPKPRGAAFSCWGREYALDALGLPAAVKSQSEVVLAAPARVVAVVDGRDVVIPVGSPRITEQKDWRVRFEGRAEGAGLKLSASGWLEQDGLVYVELTYGPAKRTAKVDALRIEFPLAETDADCLVCIGPGANFSSRTTMLIPKEKQGALWSTLVAGITGCQMKVGSFYPTVWIGSERRGFFWWADSDKGWVQDDAVPAHEAVRTGGAVVLRNHIVAKPTELAEPRTIAFSYMATPVKPFPKGWRMIAATDDGTFFQPFRAVRTNPKTGKKYHDPAHGNINWIHPESDDPAEWSALWAEQRKQADALVRQRRPFDLYGSRTGVSFQHMSFQLIGYGVKSMQKELYDYFGDEWFPGGLDTWNESYTDYAMYLFERAFREGGVVSTYWDLTFPINFDSLLSGLAYRLPDGRVQPGYNGGNIRRFFMRLWALQHDYGLNPGALGAHSTNAYVTVAMPWIDAILDGERDWHLDTSDMDWIDYYPIERMRSMSSPHNWGIGLCWMSNYTSKDPKRIVAAKTGQKEYLWMHDSWINPYVLDSRMPDSVLDWGLNGEPVTYHPYWRNPYAACADKDALVALWRMEGRILVGVYNYHRTETKEFTVKLDLAQLGLAARDGMLLAARDLYRPEGAPEAAFDAAAGTLTFKGLPPHRVHLVGLRATDQAALAKATAQLAALGAGAPAELPAAVLDNGLITPQTTYAAPGQTPEIQASEGIQVAAWRLPDRVLLAITNPGDHPKDAMLKVDLDKLGITPKLPWQEFVGVRTLYAEEKAPAPCLDFYGRTLTLKAIPPKGGRLVAVRKC